MMSYLQTWLCEWFYIILPSRIAIFWCEMGGCFRMDWVLLFWLAWTSWLTSDKYFTSTSIHCLLWVMALPLRLFISCSVTQRPPLPKDWWINEAFSTKKGFWIEVLSGAFTMPWKSIAKPDLQPSFNTNSIQCTTTI